MADKALIDSVKFSAAASVANNNLAFMTPSLSATQLAATRIPIPDNKPFVDKFDAGVFADIVARPVKTVVIGQDPAPGEFVPAGTPINLTLTVKDVLPVGGFKGIDATLAGKYKNIGVLQADLENAEDPVAKAARSVLDKKADYASLAANDKAAVDAFVENRVGANVDKAKAYNDISFLVHL